MKKQSRRNKPRGKAASTSARRAPGKPTRAKPSGAVRFPEIKGKTLEWVELGLNDDDSYIELSFQDQTALLFAIEPYAGFNVRADYGDWKTHNWRAIKRWPAKSP
jgi:hypothetical protein